jgi:hypothetical protein
MCSADTVKPLQNGSWLKWKYAFIEKIMHGKHTVIINVKLLKQQKLLVVGKQGKQFIVQQQCAWIFIVLCPCNI